MGGPLGRPAKAFAFGILAEGEAHELACGLQHRSSIGRLPWRTLGIDPGRTRGGECLWYAVSGSWKAAALAKPAMVNEDSAGQFRVLATDGTVIERADASESFRVVECRPGAGGFINIVVRNAQT